MINNMNVWLAYTTVMFTLIKSHHNAHTKVESLSSSFGMTSYPRHDEIKSHREDMDGPHTIHSILFCSICFRLGSTFAVISYNMASRLIMFILFGITKMRFLNII